MGVPGLVVEPLERAAALAQLGRTDEAHSALEDAVRMRPRVAEDPRRYLDPLIFQDELVDHVVEGLERAGLANL
jgi:hypothetical protein